MSYSQDIQNKIRKLKEEVLSWTQIEEAVNKSKCAVRRWCQRNSVSFDLPSKEKVSKSRITSRMALAKKRAIIEDPTISLKKIRNSLVEEFGSENSNDNAPSRTTIHNFLKKAGVQKRRLEVVYEVSGDGRNARLEFAEKYS